MEMIQAIIDSFLRAVIRFWDGRFLPKNNLIELYREEVSYLRQRNDTLIEFILNHTGPVQSIPEEESGEAEEFQNIGKPIEGTIQRRKRLEAESLAGWNRLVQEAKEEAVNKKHQTTEELEQVLEN